MNFVLLEFPEITYTINTIFWKNFDFFEEVYDPSIWSTPRHRKSGEFWALFVPNHYLFFSNAMASLFVFKILIRNDYPTLQGKKLTTNQTNNILQLQPNSTGLAFSDIIYCVWQKHFQNKYKRLRTLKQNMKWWRKFVRGKAANHVVLYNVPRGAVRLPSEHNTTAGKFVLSIKLIKFIIALDTPFVCLLIVISFPHDWITAFGQTAKSLWHNES